MPDYSKPHQYWIVGFGRSGTKWLKRMILDTLGHFDRAAAVPHDSWGGIIGMLHYHLDPLPSPSPAVYIHRDPRDVIVSMSHYWLELGGIDGVLDHHPYPAPQPIVAIGKMHNRWIGDKQIRMDFSYADLIGDTESMLHRVCEAFGIQEPDAARTQEMLAYHSYGNFMSELKRTERQRETRFQGPREGAWKNELNRTQAKRIHDGLWHWLESLGYEEDPEWWMALDD